MFLSTLYLVSYTVRTIALPPISRFALSEDTNSFKGLLRTEIEPLKQDIHELTHALAKLTSENPSPISQNTPVYPQYREIPRFQEDERSQTQLPHENNQPQSWSDFGIPPELTHHFDNIVNAFDPKADATKAPFKVPPEINADPQRVSSMMKTALSSGPPVQLDQLQSMLSNWQRQLDAMMYLQKTQPQWISESAIPNNYLGEVTPVSSA